MRLAYLVPILVVLFVLSSAYAENFSDYQYYVDVNIQNTEPVVGEAVVKITFPPDFNYSAIRSDCADILPEQNGEALSRYIDVCDPDNNTVVMFVRAQIPGTIRIYYGNPEANIPNDDSVFYKMYVDTYTLPRTSDNWDWKFIQLPNYWSETPVVVAQAITTNGSQPMSLHINNISTEGFYAAPIEPTCYDPKHASETIAYVVLPEGMWHVHGHTDIPPIYAGCKVVDAWVPGDEDSDSLAGRLDLPAGYYLPSGSQGVLVYTPASANNTDFEWHGRYEAGSWDGSGFNFAWEPQGDITNVSPPPAPETACYIITATGHDSDVFYADIYSDVDDSWNDVSYPRISNPAVLGVISYNGTDSANLRIENVSSRYFYARAQEDECYDWETSHAEEDLSYIVFAKGTYNLYNWLPDTATIDFSPERENVPLIRIETPPSPKNVPFSVEFTETVTVECNADENCGLVELQVTGYDGCYADYETNVTLNAHEEYNLEFNVVCYYPGYVKITATRHLERVEANIEYVPELTTNLIISAPSVAKPTDTIAVTAETESGDYVGDVVISLRTKENNIVTSVTADYIGNGIYTATLSYSNLPEDYYYIVAENNNVGGAAVITISAPAATEYFPYPIRIYDETSNTPNIYYAKVNGEYLELNVIINNISPSAISIDASEAANNGWFIHIPADFLRTIDSLDVVGYDEDYYIYGGSVAIVWHTGGELNLPPGETLFTIRIKSPYVEEINDLYIETGDPNLRDYLLEMMYAASNLQEQYTYYLTAKEYMDTVIYRNLRIDLSVPPTVKRGTTAYATFYVYKFGEATTPDILECEILDINGDVVQECTPEYVGPYYLVELNTDTVGTYALSITARSDHSVAYAVQHYTVESEYETGKIYMSDFIAPIGSTVTLVYSQMDGVDVQLKVYTSDGTLIYYDAMTYDPNVGAYIYNLYIDANTFTEGDYIVSVIDGTGNKDYAILRVSNIMNDIYQAVQDVNTYLYNVIEPKLDAIQSNTDLILDGQGNMFAELNDINNQLTTVLSILQDLSSDVDTEVLPYLEEINATTHQILQEVLYIKQKIDNVIIPKLDTLTNNQTLIQQDLNDIYSLLTCDQSPTGSVCFMLENMQILLEDLNRTVNDINGNVDLLVSDMSTVQSKLDTLVLYAQEINALLNCSSSPPNSVCARLETLQNRLDEAYAAIQDTNTFINQMYDYIQNDLMNAVLDVGTKVEDINSYLHGDVWNKLIDLQNKLNATYEEVNALTQLVEDHDTTVQAQLNSMRSYLEDVNAQLTQKIEEIQSTLDTHFTAIESNIASLREDTNTLKDYFNCTEPNEICTYVYNIESGVQGIDQRVSDLNSRVANLQNIVVAEFNDTKAMIRDVESNIAELKSLMLCDEYPSTSICGRLDEMNTNLSAVGSQVDAIYSYVLDIYSLAEDINRTVHQPSTWDRVFGSGGGGGGGASVISPIDVKFSKSTGTVLVGLPEWIPDGKYKVYYEGELYRYVESPPPKAEVNISEGLLKLKLSPDVKGAVRGIVVLKRGATIYKIRVTFIAVDKPVYQMPTATTRVITVEVPEGGGYVEIKGEAAKCMKKTKFYYPKGGRYKIYIPCNAEGIVKVTGRLHSYSIQYSLESSVNPEQFDMFQTTVLPIGTMLAVMLLLSFLVK